MNISDPASAFRALVVLVLCGLAVTSPAMAADAAPVPTPPTQLMQLMQLTSCTHANPPPSIRDGEVAAFLCNGQLDPKDPKGAVNPSAMRLRLNGVVMESLGAPVVTKVEDGKLQLQFRIARKLPLPDSATEWDQLLRSQTQRPLQLDATIAVGTEPAISAGKLRFEPAAAARLCPPKEGSPIYRMGETLQVLYAEDGIEVDKSHAGNAHLVIDGVVMSSLSPATVTRTPSGRGLQLGFHLLREPDREQSRKEWTQLLERQDRGYRMRLPLALQIGEGALIPLGSIDFGVTTKCRAYGTLAICLTAFVLLYAALACNASALRDRRNGPFSLAKSQMAFWGLIVVLSFIGLWFNAGTMEYLPPQVLVLIGISGATGLGSIAIGSGRIGARIARLRDELDTLNRIDTATRSNDQKLRIATLEGELKVLQEPLPDDPQGKINELEQVPGAYSQAQVATLKGLFAQCPNFIMDLLDDGDGLSIHRLQNLLWTLILGVVFVSSVAQVMAMPVFSNTLLVLMGISNGLYLGMKFPERIGAAAAD